MSPYDLCVYHRGIYERGTRFYRYLTRKERNRMAKQIASQCHDCMGRPGPPAGLSRDLPITADHQGWMTA